MSSHVRIWPDKAVEPGAKVNVNLKTGGFHRLEFGEQGIEGEIGIELTPERCVRIEAASATVVGGDIAIAHADSVACGALGDALSAGVRSAGSHVLRLGAVPAPVLGYCPVRSEADIGLYIDDSGLRMVSPAGLEVSRAVERSIEGALAREEYRRVAAENFGGERRESAWVEMYAEMLQKEAGDLAGLNATAVVSDRVTKRFVEALLEGAGVRSGGAKFYIDPGREHLAVGTDSRILSQSRTMLFAAMPEITMGRDVALPAWMPPTSEAWAAAYGSHILRYSASPSDDSDRDARNLATGQAWQQDPVLMMVRIMRLMKETGKSVDILDDTLPAFTEEQREVAVTGNPAWIVGRLGSRSLLDGVQIDLPGGSILVRPTKRGDAIRLLAQSFSSETAAELCDFIAGEIEGHKGEPFDKP